MRNILADLGLDLGKIAPAPPARATGGPFVPVTAHGVSAFDRQLYRIKLARGQVDRLQPHARRGADPQADDRRTGIDFRLRRA